MFGGTEIDDELWDDLEALLIQADVGVETTLNLIETVRERVAQERITKPLDAQRVLKEEMQRLLATFSFESFEARLSDVGGFPNAVRPRVIWVGVEPTSKLHAVHSRLHSHLRLAPERRDFHPHITLSRIKQINGPPVLPKPSRVSWTVDRVTLYKSELTPSGPIHTELACAHAN